MPELVSYSTSNPTPPPPPRLAVEESGSSGPPPDFPPIFDLPKPAPTFADRWEEFEGFRFTFLRYFTKPEDTAALRGVAKLLYDLVLEVQPADWPKLPDPETRWELTAVLGELRFLEGYLGSVCAEKDTCSLPREVESLCKFACGLSWELGEMGRRLLPDAQDHPHDARDGGGDRPEAVVAGGPSDGGARGGKRGHSIV